jgi:hypothetical protein
MDLKELLQFTSNSTVQFFYTELRDTDSARDLTQLEALHVASMLSHYAHVSRYAPATEMPPPSGVDEVSKEFEIFDALSIEQLKDQMVVRIVAARCLFALAFYSAWLENRRHLAWLEDHGRSYYLHTSNLSKTDNDKKTFWLMSKNFAAWVKACQEMQAGLRDRPFLLQ